MLRELRKGREKNDKYWAAMLCRVIIYMVRNPRNSVGSSELPDNAIIIKFIILKYSNLFRASRENPEAKLSKAFVYF